MTEKLSPIERALVAAAAMPPPEARRVLMLICQSGMTMNVPRGTNDPTEGQKHYAKREKFIKRMKGAADRVLNYARHETLRNCEKHFRDVGISSAEGDTQPTLSARITFDKQLFAEELLSALREEQQPALQVAGQHLFDEVGRDSPWKLPDKQATAFLDARANLLANVPDEVHAEIMTTIQQGLEAGESKKELMARISAAFDEIGKIRADTIANTETAAAFNFARNKAMKKAGVTHKKWLHSMSPLIQEPRPTHVEADGQVVPFDEPFDVGGVQMMHPGDESAGPEEVINCHCVAIPVEAPIESGDAPGHEFRGNQWTGGKGHYKTASEISGVTPEDAPLKSFTAYHVTKRENVDSITKNGFDMSHVKPRWQNDYAVSLSRGKKAATNYFSQRDKPFDSSKYALLEVSGKGRLFSDPSGFKSPIGIGVASDPRDYTRRMIAQGYDGHDLGGTIYVHNPKSITNIREVAP